jgi:hypothetical protein
MEKTSFASPLSSPGEVSARNASGPSASIFASRRFFVALENLPDIETFQAKGVRVACAVAHQAAVQDVLSRVWYIAGILCRAANATSLSRLLSKSVLAPTTSAAARRSAKVAKAASKSRSLRASATMTSRPPPLHSRSP